MANLQQLEQALTERQKQALWYEQQLMDSFQKQRAYDTRRSRGIIPLIGETIFDSIRKKQTKPEHEAALRNALDHASGVTELERQIAEQQAQMDAANEQAEMARRASVAQGAGYAPGQARAVAEGIDLPKQPELPALIKTMQAAGIDPRSPEGQQLIRESLTKSQVSVNTGSEGPQIGTIPQGFQVAKDPSGAWRMEPVPGGPAEFDRQDAQKKQEGRKRQAELAGSVVFREIDRAFDLIGDMHQGEDVTDRYWRAARTKIKGTPEEIMMSTVLGPIKAELGFARIQQMRENSPTGGALGQVSNFEVDNLQKTAGLFDADMPLPMLKENLSDLRVRFLDTIHGTAAQREELVRNGVVTPEQNAQIEALYSSKSTNGGEKDPVRVSTPAEAQQLPPGTIYITPDGRKYTR